MIKDFAAMKTPFRETAKFFSSAPDLKQYDIGIESIDVSSTVVTITTDEAHGRAIGANSDTVYLDDIQQDSDEDVDDIEGTLITSLNGTTETIIVTTTTAFTIATAGVDASWVHEANTGIVSYVPDIRPWQYAFKLPSDYLAMVRQTDEFPTTRGGVKTEYQCRTITNKDGDGLLLLSNTLSNQKANGAYIEYVVDLTTFALFSIELEECIATLLAAELCPIVGRDLETRQAVLAEYEELTKPEAKRNVQSQYDNASHSVARYDGRSFVSGVPTGRTSDLGTYVSADGTRRSI